MRVKEAIRGTPLEPIARTALGASRSLRAGLARVRRSVGTLPVGWNYRRALRKPLQWESFGEPGSGGVTVVMCLWNRPERLPAILEMLGEQTGTGPVTLLLWNNRASDTERYRRALAGFVRTGALAGVRLHNAKDNIGGIGRFIAIRDTQPGESVVTLDDDQNVTPHFLSDLLRHAAPRTIAGVWAWRIGDDYWDRTQVTEDGAPADHVGTGGAVIDAALVRDKRFFTGLPSRYLFMEDIWMSQVARANGWRILAADTPIEFVLEERDQGHAIYADKGRFYRWLHRSDHIPVLGGVSSS